MGARDEPAVSPAPDLRERRPRRADIALALGWIALGAIVSAAAWRMDRLEHLGIAPGSAPGVLAGVLGVLIVGLGLALLWRELRAPAAAATVGNADAVEGEAGGDGWGAALGAAALCVFFAAGLLGRGLPFPAITAAFVASFMLVFDPRPWRSRIRLAPLASTLAIASISAIAVTWLFGEIFLVRLP